MYLGIGEETTLLVEHLEVLLADRPRAPEISQPGEIKVDKKPRPGELHPRGSKPDVEREHNLPDQQRTPHNPNQQHHRNPIPRLRPQSKPDREHLGRARPDDLPVPPIRTQPTPHFPQPLPPREVTIRKSAIPAYTRIEVRGARLSIIFTRITAKVYLKDESTECLQPRNLGQPER